MGLTAQQEAFAQALASGETQAEAYRIGYPKSRGWKDETVWRKASLLAKHGEVRARVAELRASVIEQVEITLEERIARYRHLSDLAEKSDDIHAAIRAEDSLTRIAGMFAADRANERAPLVDALTELTQRHRAKHNGHSTH